MDSLFREIKSAIVPASSPQPTQLPNRPAARSTSLPHGGTPPISSGTHPRILVEGHMMKHGSFLALSGQPRFMRLWSDGTLEGFKQPPSGSLSPTACNRFNVLHSSLQIHPPFMCGSRSVHQITFSFFDPTAPTRAPEKRLFELGSKQECDTWVAAIVSLPRVAPATQPPVGRRCVSAGEGADDDADDILDNIIDEDDAVQPPPPPSTPQAKTLAKSKLESQLLTMAKKAGAQLCALKWTGTIKLSGKVFGIGLMVGVAITRARIMELEASGNSDAVFDEDDDNAKVDTITKKTLKFFDKAALQVRSLATHMQLEGLTGIVGASIDFTFFGTGLSLEIEIDVESIIGVALVRESTKDSAHSTPASTQAPCTRLYAAASTGSSST